MTDQHPLTDEIIHREFLPKYCYTENDLRLVADWQLEQVIQTWEQCRKEKRSCIEVVYLFHQKLKAMRPQQQENN